MMDQNQQYSRRYVDEFSISRSKELKMHVHHCSSQLDLHLLTELELLTVLSCARVGLRPPSLLLLLLLLISESLILVLFQFFFSTSRFFYTRTHGHLSEGEVERLDVHQSLIDWMIAKRKEFFSKLQCGLNTEDFYLLRQSLLKCL